MKLEIRSENNEKTIFGSYLNENGKNRRWSATMRTAKDGFWKLTSWYYLGNDPTFLTSITVYVNRLNANNS